MSSYTPNHIQQLTPYWEFNGVKCGGHSLMGKANMLWETTFYHTSWQLLKLCKLPLSNKANDLVMRLCFEIADKARKLYLEMEEK